MTTLIDDRDPSISYGKGSWRQGGGPDEYDDTTTLTNVKGATAKLTFFGTSVSVYGTVSPVGSFNSPTCSYSVDGGDPAIYAAPMLSVTQYRVLFFQSTQLMAQSHTLVITILSEDSTLFLDYFAVTPPITTTSTLPPATPVFSSTSVFSSTPIVSSTPSRQVISASLSFLDPLSYTPSGVSTTSTRASTSLLSTIAAGSGDTSTTGASKSSNIGRIVGAVNGCIMTIVVTFAIIIWRRRRRSLKLIPTNAAPEGQLGSVQPFVLHPRNGSPVQITGPNGTDALPFPSLLGTDSANKAGLLLTKFTRVETVTLGDAGSPSSNSNTMSARAELVHQERERIIREIAFLANRSTASESHLAGSPYGAELSDSSSHPIMAKIPPIPIDNGINNQLVSLREQFRQIEQMHGPSALA